MSKVRRSASTLLSQSAKELLESSIDIESSDSDSEEKKGQLSTRQISKRKSSQPRKSSTKPRKIGVKSKSKKAKANKLLRNDMVVSGSMFSTLPDYDLRDEFEAWFLSKSYDTMELKDYSEFLQPRLDQINNGRTIFSILSKLISYENQGPCRNYILSYCTLHLLSDMTDKK
jgi:hypothetical protein